jgi:hypothetical protein
VPGGPLRRRSGRSHEASGNGRPRGMAVTAPEARRATGGGTEPGLRAVWHRPAAARCGGRPAKAAGAGLWRGRCAGRNGDNYAFLGKTLWIADCPVAARLHPPKLERVWSRR